LFIGEVVAACADPAALRTLHNVAVGQFFYMTGETLVAARQAEELTSPVE